MAKYIVTGACIQVHTQSTDGTPVLVYRYQGNEVELAKADAEHLLSVNLIARVSDVLSDPVVNPAAGQVGVQGTVAVSGRPDDDADKALWVAYAVSQGLAEADAEIADLADLKAIYSDPATSAPSVDVKVNLLPRPQTDGTKAEWVAYAVQQGIPLLEAQASTRDKLAADARLKK